MDDTTLEITELPVRKWTQDYKEFLEGLIKPADDKAGPPLLADYREHHSDADVHFTLQLLPEAAASCQADGLHAKFKLVNKMSCGVLVSSKYINSLSCRLAWLSMHRAKGTLGPQGA